MRICRTLALLVASAVGVPCNVLGQAIAGVVNDAAGAAPADVTIEARSSALIERARTVITDGSGQYRRPPC